MTPEQQRKREMIRAMLAPQGEAPTGYDSEPVLGQEMGARRTAASHPGRLYFQPDMKGGGQYVPYPPEVWGDGLTPDSAYPNAFPRTMYYNPEQHQYTPSLSAMTENQSGLAQIMPPVNLPRDPDDLAPVFQQMLSDMSPQEQEQVFMKIRMGMSLDEAFAPAGVTPGR